MIKKKACTKLIFENIFIALSHDKVQKKLRPLLLLSSQSSPLEETSVMPLELEDDEEDERESKLVWSLFIRSKNIG